MEGLLTTHELTNSLFKHMKGNSSPGIDGFTVNHLRTFWFELKHITCDALNCSFGGQLTSSLRKAVIKLLRKGNKDQTLTGNYRPISLLSIFYKLASCTITQRIKPAVNQIIGKQQKAYIKTNNIGSIILNLLNMIKHVTEKKKISPYTTHRFSQSFRQHRSHLPSKHFRASWLWPRYNTMDKTFFLKKRSTNPDGRSHL